MPELSPETAVARARGALGLPASVTGRAWRTRRLDRPGDAYYLVVFGPEDAAVAVAAVDARSGEVQSSARLPGAAPLPVVDAARALELAGVGDGAQAELVWRPCRASRSPLYPLWEVRSGADPVYVDQQGKLWPQLDPAGPGG
jgi:hypothetical protein